MSLLRGAVDWSDVCGCGNSRPYSLVSSSHWLVHMLLSSLLTLSCVCVRARVCVFWRLDMVLLYCTLVSNRNHSFVIVMALNQFHITMLSFFNLVTYFFRYLALFSTLSTVSCHATPFGVHTLYVIPNVGCHHF